MTKIRLSTLDHMFIGSAYEPCTFVLVYEGALDVARLRDALSRACADFPGISARLRRGDDGAAYLDCTDDAVELEVVDAGEDTDPDVCIPSLTTAWDAPVARARITYLGSTRTAVGLAMSHCVADGSGFFMFLSAWAAYANERRFPKPNSDRGLMTVAARVDASPAVVERELALAGLRIAADDSLAPRQRWYDEVLPPVPASDTTRADKGVSTGDLLSARLWKRSLDFTTSTETTFVTYVDLRPQRRELGPLYFGNAVLPGVATVATDELRAASDEEAARWVRSAIVAVGPRVSRTLENLESLRIEGGLTQLSRVRNMPEMGSGFAVSNLAGVPLDALNFGRGAPVEVALGAAPLRSAAAIVVRRRGELIVRMTRP